MQRIFQADSAKRLVVRVQRGKELYYRQTTKKQVDFYVEFYRILIEICEISLNKY